MSRLFSPRFLFFPLALPPAMAMAMAMVLAMALTSAIPAQTKGLFDHDVFRTYSLKFKSSNWYQQILANKAAEIYIKADFTVDNVTYKDVGVRGRGGVTWGVGKQTGKVPFKFSFDHFVPGRRFMGRRSINFNNSMDHPSFMKDVVCLRLARRSVLAPEANFVNLVMNGTNWGVYCQIEVVNKDFLERHFDDPDGNRYKGDPPSFSASLPLMSAASPSSPADITLAYKTSTSAWPGRGVNTPKIVDVDLAHRVSAFNAVIANRDAWPRKNYYLYFDPKHTQMSLILWDVNRAFATLRPSYMHTPSYYPGQNRNTTWSLRYQAHVRTFAEDLDPNEITNWITAYQKLIGNAIKADTKRPASYTYNLFLSSASELPTKLKANKATAISRLGATEVQFSQVAHTPSEPVPSKPVWVNVKAKSSYTITGVTMHWRSKGYYRELAMLDDGKSNDGRACLRRPRPQESRRPVSSPPPARFLWSPSTRNAVGSP